MTGGFFSIQLARYLRARQINSIQAAELQMVHDIIARIEGRN